MNLYNKQLIIAIVSCNKHRSTRQQDVLNTWIKDMPDNVEWFFVEGGDKTYFDKENHRLVLDCPDTYEHLALKTHKFLNYIVDNLSFDYLLKVDDDTLINMDNLLTVDLPESDYIGSTNGSNTYAQGGAYLLSEKSAITVGSYDFELGVGSRWWYGGQFGNEMWKSVTDDIRDNASVEDMMVGDVLMDSGIQLDNIERFELHVPHWNTDHRQYLLSSGISQYISLHPFIGSELKIYYEKIIN